MFSGRGGLLGRLRLSLSGRRFCSLGSRCGGLALCRRLHAEFLRKALDATLGVDQLLAAREERVARRADFEVQFGLGRTRLERVAARAANFDLLVLWMNPCLHGVLPFDSLRSLRASPHAWPRVRSLWADFSKERKHSLYTPRHYGQGFSGIQRSSDDTTVGVAMKSASTAAPSSR